MKKILPLLIFVLISLPAWCWAKNQTDSLGVENRIDKTIVLHKVEEGQTLYSILKRYTCSYKDYVSENPGDDIKVNIGQILRIPTLRSVGQVANAKGNEAKKENTENNKEKPNAKIEGNPKTQVELPKQTPKNSNDELDRVIVKTESKPKAEPSAIKVEPIGAKTHVVETKQTLFFIANRYGTTVENLKSWNNLPSNDVKIGQILAVSKPKGWRAVKSNAENTPKPIEKPKENKVLPKEEAIKIDSPTPFKKEVKKGEITKTEEGRTVVTQDEEDEATKATPKLPSDIKMAENKVKEEAKREALEQREREKEAKKAEDSAKIKKSVTENKPKKTEESNDEDRPRPQPQNNTNVNYKTMKEDGLAGLIDIQGQSEKLLALHRTAPVGTLIQVKNLTNNRSVQVRVIGRLPDTGINDKYVIKISPKAFDKLNPIDKKIRAELNYSLSE